MKSIVIAVIAVAGIAASGMANAQEALAKSSGCMNCHDMTAKKMGPSFKDIAAKYKGKSGSGQGPPGGQGVGRRPEVARQVGAVAVMPR
jgi:cytochrome c551/c552